MGPSVARRFPRCVCWTWASLSADLTDRLDGAFDGWAEPAHKGRSRATDAPFSEAQAAIDAARARGIHAVEMEAASLYANAAATDAEAEVRPEQPARRS